MRRVFDNIEVKASLPLATITATTNGSGVDTLGYTDGMVQIVAGAIDLASGNETYTFSVEESDDNSTFTAVSGLTTTVTANSQLKEIRLAELNLTRKRYIRVVGTLAGTTPSFAGVGLVVLGNKQNAPVGNAA